MPESQSSKFRKRWPWDWEKEELTDAVQVEIVENLYSYAKDVAYWYPEDPDYHYWYNGLKVYCKVSRDYFIKVTKEAPDSIKPKLSEIAEEAFELLNTLLKWANQKYSLCFVTEPEKRFYNIAYSDEELHNNWQTIVHKLNLYMNSGNQAEELAEPEPGTAPAKGMAKIGWLKRIAVWIFKKTWHLIVAIIVAIIGSFIAAILIRYFW